MSLAQRPESVSPDAVFMGGEEANVKAADMPDWELLNPCPLCGATPHDAPEGVNIAGDPHWTNPHCFKCGYRPGVNAANDEQKLRQMFEQFKKMYQQETADAMQHPTLQPPQPDQVAELQAQMQAMQEELARYKADGGVPTQQPFTPNTTPIVPDQPPAGNPQQQQP